MITSKRKKRFETPPVRMDGRIFCAKCIVAIFISKIPGFCTKPIFYAMSIACIRIQKGFVYMDCKNEKLKIMREEAVPKALLKMALPTMIGMVVSALYSVVDAFFVGGLGTSQMGAVSVTFPIGQVVVGLGMMFGSGAGSYISRLLGAGENEKANRTASTALFSSLLTGIVLIGISLCFLNPLLTALGATKTILPYARQYGMIYITGSILNIFTSTMNNIMTAEGLSGITMTSFLLSSVVNIILNPIFIYVLGFGIRGSAISTVIAQVVITVMYLWIILSKKGVLRFSPANIRLDVMIYRQIFKVGIPILVYQFLTSLAIGLTNTAANAYGDSAVAAFGVVTRITALVSYLVFGFTDGYQPVAGYNYGAKSYGRLKEATKLSFLWTTVFCAAAAVVLIAFPVPILTPFSRNDPELIRIGSEILRANGCLFTLFGFEMVSMSLFLSIGKGTEGGILSISRQGLFFLPAVLILPRFFGMEGIVWAQPAADVLTVILSAVFLLGLNKKLKAKTEAPTEPKNRAA